MSKQINNLKVARVLLASALAIILMVGSDPALAWGKKKKESKNEPVKAVNLDKHPTMSFFRGVLHQDIHGEWRLGDKPLSFNTYSRISDTPGSEGGTALIDGSTARVTAANIGGTLLVHRVTMMSQKEMMERGGYSVGGSTEEPKPMSSSEPR